MCEHTPRGVPVVHWTALAMAFAAITAPTSSSAAPQTPKTSIQPTKSAVTLAARSGPLWTPAEASVIRGAEVQRDPSTWQVRRVRGRAIVAGARDARSAADGFLRANHAVLGLTADLRELRLLGEKQSLTATHVRYAQVLAGLPVVGGNLSVHVDRGMAVLTANIDVVSVKGAVSTIGMRSERDAITAATGAVKAHARPTVAPTAEPAVLPIGGRPVVVWRVLIDTTDPPGTWEALLEARTLRALLVRNLAKFVDGAGMVFDPNPIATSGDPTLQDNGNVDSATLTAQRVSVTLRGLDGTGYLQGDYCTTAPTAGQPRAHDSLNTFNFTRSDPRFDEVMSYHHIDSCQRYIQSLGFLTVNNRQVGVNVNGSPDDNSWYSPSSKELTFGSGGVNDSQDADIIWHELGHAIQDDQVPGFGTSAESGAIGEGFGDYWAASRSAGIGPKSPEWDPVIGEWDASAYNPGNPPYLRRVDGTKHYPEEMVGEVHDDGEIWSACLWQIRTLVGRTRADTLVLESQFTLAPNATFQDAALAIVGANTSLYADADRAAILDIFYQRGILVNPRSTSLAVASMPAMPGRLVQLTATLVRSGDRGALPSKGVAFSVAGTAVGSALTNASGVASLAYSVPIGAAYGQQAIRADYAGDAETNSSSGAGWLYVVQTYGASGTVTDGGAPMAGVSVMVAGLGATVSSSPGAAIPDGDPVGLTALMDVPNSGAIGSLTVTVGLTHTYIGDLEVALIHPDGTTVLLHDRTGSDQDNLNTTYPVPTTPAQSLGSLAGKPMAGTWRLRVRDLAPTDSGTLNSWAIAFTRATPITATAQTNAGGVYAVQDLEPGLWRLTPSSGNATFAPAFRDVTVGPTRSGIDFARDSFMIAGRVTAGVVDYPGVEVAIASATSRTVEQSSSPGLDIPDNNTTGLETPISVAQAGALTAVHVGVDITHTYIGDLEVSLIHPDGTRVILHNQTGSNGQNLQTIYPDLTAPHQSLNMLAGKPIAGTWKLRVRDLSQYDYGRLNSWSLSITYGSTQTLTTTTGADGRYAFPDCPSGAHRVTPSKSGATFAPVFSDVTVGPARSNVDFSAQVIPTKVTVSAASGSIGQTLSLSAKLERTDTSAALDGKILSFAVDGSAIDSATTDGTGTATVSYKLPESAGAGNRLLSAAYAANLQYAGSSGTAPLPVSKSATSIFVPDRTQIAGQPIVLRGYLKRLTDSTMIQGRSLSFAVAGTTVGTGTTDATGMATYTWTVTGGGVIRVDFAGDAAYHASYGTGTMIAQTYATKVYVVDRTAKIKTYVVLKAYLYRLDNTPVSGKIMTVKVDGVDLGTDTTRPSGYVQLGYTVPEAAGSGVRVIRGEFDGDAGYTASANNGKLTALKGDVYIWPYVRSGKRGTNHPLKAYVRSLPDYVILPGKSISFKVNGSLISTTVVASDGWATVDWAIPSGETSGAHTATAEFAGDAWYQAVAASTSFNVVL